MKKYILPVILLVLLLPIAVMLLRGDAGHFCWARKFYGCSGSVPLHQRWEVMEISRSSHSFGMTYDTEYCEPVLCSLSFEAPRYADEREIVVRMFAEQYAEGAIILNDKNFYEDYVASGLSPREWAESAGLKWLDGGPRAELVLPMEKDMIQVALVYRATLSETAPPHTQPYVLAHLCIFNKEALLKKRGSKIARIFELTEQDFLSVE